MAKKDLFTGRSGQLAVMAEFLIRNQFQPWPPPAIPDGVVLASE